MRVRKYEAIELASAIRDSESWAETARKLNLSISGGLLKGMKSLADRYGISYEHFVGRAYSKGRLGRVAPNKRSLEEVLVKDSTYSGNKLRARLVKEGLKEHKCESCSRKKWLGRVITLEVDHINGVNTDHRIENLRLLCPNCHSQTDTWRGRNNKVKTDNATG